MTGKRIVLGVTGGIAAYKAAELCRLLVRAGAVVRVVMTEAACRFISPLTMQTLSGAQVRRDLFDLGEESEIGHIGLADQADLVIVAPATADAIARMAAGMADDLLTAVLLATRAPVLLAPAMNVNMWENPLTQGNLRRLLSGAEGGGRFTTVGPDRGELACGWVGAGRLMEPADIVAAAERILTGGDLMGRRVVVTAGPTREAIDQVRYLGNRSSGKMGFALARAAALRGAEVTLIAGPVSLPTPGGVQQRVDVESTAEMRQALLEASRRADVVVMAAAVADFRPVEPASGKLSRRLQPSETTLALTPNPDLLGELGSTRLPAAGGGAARPYLVGFAAETNLDDQALAAAARKKLAEKHCDAVVGNDIGRPGVGFGSDDNSVVVVFADGVSQTLPRAPKAAIAEALWTLLVPRLPGGASTGETSGPAASASVRVPAV
jgi:phosphopantothenoylcysteine decarboxylase/phosphopantothenate--cysteine ligase